MERTNENLNLSVLRRHNPSILSIISLASYSVIYTFSPTSGTWEKNGIEGTMFVCSLSPPLDPSAGPQDPDQERYSVIVLNRRGLDNFEIELSSAEDVDVKSPPFVIISGKNEGDGEGEEGVGKDHMRTPVAYGVWIFAEPGTSTEDTRELNATVIRDCAARAEESRRVSVAGRAGAMNGRAQQGQGQGQANGDQAMGMDGSADMEGRQLNLLDLFKRPDAAQQPGMPPGEIAAQPILMNPSAASLTTQAQTMQPSQDVLGDLFRRATHEYSSAL